MKMAIPQLGTKVKRFARKLDGQTLKLGFTSILKQYTSVYHAIEVPRKTWKCWGEGIHDRYIP